MTEPTARSRSATPTARQKDYLDFIRAFTERWGVPPSFDDLGRHFRVSPPAVNTMVKMLEARGFLTRVPGQARTLRVLLPADTPGSAVPDQKPSQGTDIGAAIEVAALVIERLVPALRGLDESRLVLALDAVSQALRAACRVRGASDDELGDAHAHLRRVALIARGLSPETSPRLRGSRRR